MDCVANAQLFRSIYAQIKAKINAKSVQEDSFLNLARDYLDELKKCETPATAAASLTKPAAKSKAKAKGRKAAT